MKLTDIVHGWRRLSDGSRECDGELEIGIDYSRRATFVRVRAVAGGLEDVIAIDVMGSCGTIVGGAELITRNGRAVAAAMPSIVSVPLLEALGFDVSGLGRRGYKPTLEHYDHDELQWIPIF